MLKCHTLCDNTQTLIFNYIIIIAYYNEKVTRNQILNMYDSTKIPDLVLLKRGRGCLY